jgi:predicted CoA-substrate-specific enzyme activase
MPPLYAGIDLGSSYAKGVLVDRDGQVVATHARRTGVAFETVAAQIRDALASTAGGWESVLRTVATGYGRHNVGFADRVVTEITCQAHACFREVGRAVVIVDVGGQDTKVIRVGDDGQQRSFTMNRKCAAGTGAFLEEMAFRLDLPLSELDLLASRGTEPVSLSSYCTVFAKSELLTLIRQGRRLEDIALGIYEAVARRVLEMDPLDGEVVLTGGVAEHHKTLVNRIEAALGRPVVVPEAAQFTVALGAALIAAGGRGSGPGGFQESGK